jgi:hypothetical protein
MGMSADSGDRYFVSEVVFAVPPPNDDGERESNQPTTLRRVLDSAPLWGSLAVVFTLVPTVIAAMMHDIRWLLWFAWPFAVFFFWEFARTCTKRRAVIAMTTSIAAIGTASFWGWLYVTLAPEPQTALAANPPNPVASNSSGMDQRIADENGIKIGDHPDLLSMFVRDPMPPPVGFQINGCTEYDRPDAKGLIYYKIVGDVPANSKYLLFYLPKSQYSLAIINLIAMEVSEWIAHVENTIHFNNQIQGNTSPIESKDMVFSNAIYIYHEDVLDAIQIGEVTKLF